MRTRTFDLDDGPHCVALDAHRWTGLPSELTVDGASHRIDSRRTTWWWRGWGGSRWRCDFAVARYDARIVCECSRPPLWKRLCIALRAGLPVAFSGTGKRAAAAADGGSSVLADIAL